ncbi:MAG: hypothetical protein MPI81_00235 [Synechococcus sp. H1_metabat_bins_2.tsv.006]|jgi:hypothetical protein|nr:hypothetical protein [Synechococcus sp. H1_metabat_bins_2.tsv.006]
MTAPSEPRWFVLAMASRWPAAIVLAAWAVAVAAIQILKQPLPVALPQQKPFPVRLVGGVTVEKINLPVVQVSASEPLPVSGEVSVEKTVGVEVNSFKQPIDVGSFEQAVPVTQNEPFEVTGAVTVKQIQGKLDVKVNPLPGGLPIP